MKEMGKDNSKTDAGILFDEMNLYYEEIRNINDRTITYLKILGVLALTLATYMTFGIRSSVSAEFLSAKAENIDATATATSCYAVLGLGLSFSYVFVYIYSFLQYGRSRVHKIRFWRSVSILREKLHRFNNILPERGRAIPLQTGLELTWKKRYHCKVPKPIIHKRDYNLMYYLAILIFLMFSIPCVFFAGILVYAMKKFALSEYLSLAYGFYFSSPLIAMASIILATFAFEMSRTLNGAQFITEEQLDFEIKDRPLRNYELWIVRIIRSMLIALVFWYLWHLFALLRDFDETNHSMFSIVSSILIGGFVFERIMTNILKQFSFSESVLVFLGIIFRLFTKQPDSWVERVTGKQIAHRVISTKSGKVEAMRVKYLRGNRNTEYTLVMAEEKSISDLGPHIREKIGLLGDLKEIRKEDLTNRMDPLSIEIIQQIKEQGVHLLKTIVRIEEIEPGTPTN